MASVTLATYAIVPERPTIPGIESDPKEAESMVLAIGVLVAVTAAVHVATATGVSVTDRLVAFVLIVGAYVIATGIATCAADQRRSGGW